MFIVFGTKCYKIVTNSNKIDKVLFTYNRYQQTRLICSIKIHIKCIILVYRVLNYKIITVV